MSERKSPVHAQAEAFGIDVRTPVSLQPDDDGNEVHVGTGAVDVLNDDILEISQTELDQITAGTVLIAFGPALMAADLLP